MQSKSIVDSEPADVFLIGVHQYKGRVFGIQVNQNIIMELDHDRGVLIWHDFIPDVPKGRKAFHRVCVNENKAYFVPFEYDWLYIYDFEKENYTKIHINLKTDKMVKSKGNFYEIVVLDNEVVLLPFSYRGVVFVNLITGEQTDIDIEADFKKDKQPLLFRKYVKIDDKHVAVPSLSSNKIMILDLEKKSYRIAEAGNSNVKIGGIYRIDNRLYILCKNFPGIWESDLQLEHIREIKCLQEIAGGEEEKMTYFDPETVEEYGGSLFLFPAKWNHALKIDLKQDKAEIIEPMEKFCSDSDLVENISIIDGGVRCGRCIYLHYQLNKILRFDMETEEIIEYPRVFRDAENIILKDFLNRVINGTPSITAHEENTVGRKIYELLK